MATLTISNLPDTLYGSLADRAQHDGTTVEAAAVAVLQSALGGTDVEAELEKIRSVRQSVKGIFVTEDELRAAKAEGRP